MSLYYIGELISVIQAGGDAVNQRNIKVLKHLYENDFNLIPISYTSRLVTFANLLLGYMCGLSPFKVKKILKQLKGKRNLLVFLPTSKMGKLAYMIKKQNPDAKIMVFFHNIEKQYAQEEYRVDNSLKNRLLLKIVSYNEVLACRYGDSLIVLNGRDEKLLLNYYQRSADLILPITFEDKFDAFAKKKCLMTTKKKFVMLFVGSAFFANIEGLNWFIFNVFPYLSSCYLVIVGNKMDNYFHSDENMEVHGYVENLAEFYYQCDLVISPILSGGGMKTKTAEALMYGCPIVGTKEAFEGYDVVYDEIGACCHSAQEMIHAIKHLQSDSILLEDCSHNARNVYMETYTFESSIKKMKTFIDLE